MKKSEDIRISLRLHRETFAKAKRIIAEMHKQSLGEVSDMSKMVRKLVADYQLGSDK